MEGGCGGGVGMGERRHGWQGEEAGEEWGEVVGNKLSSSFATMAIAYEVEAPLHGKG